MCVSFNNKFIELSESGMMTPLIEYISFKEINSLSITNKKLKKLIYSQFLSLNQCSSLKSLKNILISTKSTRFRAEIIFRNNYLLTFSEFFNKFSELRTLIPELKKSIKEKTKLAKLKKFDQRSISDIKRVPNS